MVSNSNHLSQKKKPPETISASQNFKTDFFLSQFDGTDRQTDDTDGTLTDTWKAICLLNLYVPAAEMVIF